MENGKIREVGRGRGLGWQWETGVRGVLYGGNQ